MNIQRNISEYVVINTLYNLYYIVMAGNIGNGCYVIHFVKLTEKLLFWK